LRVAQMMYLTIVLCSFRVEKILNESVGRNDSLC